MASFTNWQTKETYNWLNGVDEGAFAELDDMAY